VSDNMDFVDVNLDNQNLVGSNNTCSSCKFCLVFSEIVEKTTSLVSSYFLKIRNLVESLNSSWVLSSEVELLKALDDVIGETGERVSSDFKGLISLASKVRNGKEEEKKKFLDAVLHEDNVFWSSFKLDDLESFKNEIREEFSLVSYTSIERFKENGGTAQDVIDYINGPNTFDFGNFEVILSDIIESKNRGELGAF
jgi:hypothetical protein